MIRDLYTDMLKRQGLDEKIEAGFQKEIVELLTDYEEQLDAAAYKKMQDTAFFIASMAEENGFEKGVKYAFRLFAECMA